LRISKSVHHDMTLGLSFTSKLYSNWRNGSWWTCMYRML